MFLRESFAGLRHVVQRTLQAYGCVSTVPRVTVEGEACLLWTALHDSTERCLAPCARVHAWPWYLIMKLRRACGVDVLHISLYSTQPAAGKRCVSVPGCCHVVRDHVPLGHAGP